VNYNAGYCTGYVFGLVELHEGAIRMSLQPLRPLFCLPTGAGRIEQLVRVVAHYLEAHPERLHLLQRDLVIEAFREAFPCTPASKWPQR